MINEGILSQLREMKLDGMVKELTHQLEHPEEFSHLSFQERLGLLVSAEWSRKKTNRINRYITQAKFSIPSATIDAIEYYPDRCLDRTQIMDFALCKFIHERHNIILKGAAGNGKSYIACALGNAACRRDMSVMYIRLPELLDELQIAHEEQNFQKIVAAYKRFRLLIIDEWLIRVLTPSEAYDLLELIEARYDKGSIIFCTQYSTEEWYGRISPAAEDGSPISEAILDRIVHNSYQIDIKGNKSMRKRHGLFPDSEDNKDNNAEQLEKTPKDKAKSR